jgi:ribosomal protein L11 methylase PrmA
VSPTRHPASFRDPSGFLFYSDGVLHRHVAPEARESYDALLDSGLYARLVDEGLLVAHHEEAETLSPGAYKVVRPDPIPFISYPYEWCFAELRAAALATLRIQALALEHGMSLRDASAYNVQFRGSAPVLIDTLSFERYEEGAPWVAYRQFCQHFLAPLALMAHRDVEYGRLLRVHIDGLPLDFASRALPAWTRLHPSLGPHLHLHARYQRAHADARGGTGRSAKVTRRGLEGILASLESGVRGLRWKPGRTEWGDYYEETNYTAEAQASKRSLVERLCGGGGARLAFDLGANTGEFSRCLSERGIYTVAFDVDPAAVESNYRRCEEEGEAGLLPLWMDLTNPSPALGWAHLERDALESRGPADLLLALALVHHLAISNNLPLGMISSWLARLGHKLVIEFVPKQDSQVQRLLATREDVFPDYHRDGFESGFGEHWRIEERCEVEGSERARPRCRYWSRCASWARACPRSPSAGFPTPG